MFTFCPNPRGAQRFLPVIRPTDAPHTEKKLNLTPSSRRSWRTGQVALTKAIHAPINDRHHVRTRFSSPAEVSDCSGVVQPMSAKSYVDKTRPLTILFRTHFDIYSYGNRGDRIEPAASCSKALIIHYYSFGSTTRSGPEKKWPQRRNPWVLWLKRVIL